MAESGKRVIVDGIEYQRVFQFPRMLGAITAAMQPSRIIIALFMVVLLIAVGRLWDRFTEPNVHPAGLVQGRFEPWMGEDANNRALVAAIGEFAEHRMPDRTAGEWVPPNTRTVMAWVYEGYLTKRSAATTDEARSQLDTAYAIIAQRVEMTRPRGDFEATVAHVTNSFHGMLQGVCNLNAREVLGSANMLFVQTPLALWRYQTWFAILYGAFTLIVLAIGGGAISRMAAVFQSREQRLSLNEATDFALDRWAGLVWAKALPIVLLGFLALVIIAVGFLMRIPILDVLTALLYGLVLLLGFLMAFLLLGYAIGFPMLIPAVTCENCDGADAMQRTYAYLVNRPLHAIWYWAVGLFGLAVGFTIVSTLAYLTLNVAGSMFGELATESAIAVAGGYDAVTFRHDAGTIVTGNWHQRMAASIVLAWQSLVVCLVAAYVISYFFSASTVGYLLMRKASDGQEPDEIWRPGLIPGTLAPAPLPLTVETVSREP